MRTLGSIITAAVAVLISASAACGDSGSAGTGGGDCSPSPFQCAATQVCWPNEDVSTFTCLEARTDKKVGDPCDFIGGQVTCPTGAVCIVQGPGQGLCTPYCDDDHDCPGFASCVKYSIDAPNGMKTYDLLACDVQTIGTGSSTSSTGAG